MAFWTEEMDGTLRALQEQVRELRRLRDVVETGPGRMEALQKELPGLESAAKRARKQADRKARGGVWAFPHLSPEKQAKAAEDAEQAAREADRAYQSARRELDDANRDLPYAQKRLTELEGCETQFESLLAQKAERLSTMEQLVSGTLEELDRKAAEAARRAQVLQDALAGGQDAVPRLNQFVHRMYDFDRAFSDFYFIMTAEKSYQLERAREAFQSIRDLLDAYCVPDFPSPVSEELKAAIGRWCLRAEKLLWHTHHMDIFHDDIKTLITQAENLRGHIRDTFPQLEVAVEEAAAAAVRAKDRRENFICDTPVPGPGRKR